MRCGSPWRGSTRADYVSGMRKPSPAFGSGVGLALAAAVAFGVTTPVIARCGVSALTTAAALYVGAFVAALVLRLVTKPAGGAVERRHVGRLVVAGVVGAALAPTLLAWGLSRTGAVTGSLLLCGEPIFTALIAWRVFGEPTGRRFVVALLLMIVASVLLVAGPVHLAGGLGLLALVAATLCWAVDNTVSRGLGEQDPLTLVQMKGLIGAVLTAMLALLTHATLPTTRALLALLACGAIGYGLSLRLYLEAQRRIGAGRTGSVFAVAPFIGAGLAYALGERAPVLRSLGAAVLFGIAVYLHLTEKHHHRHRHEPLDHEHPHTHDDGHHDHVHTPQVAGTHSHPHHHEAKVHDHDHAPDLHHHHRH